MQPQLPITLSSSASPPAPLSFALPSAVLAAPFSFLNLLHSQENSHSAQLKVKATDVHDPVIAFACSP